DVEHREVIVEELLKRYLSANHFEKAHRLRFDFKVVDSKLIAAFKAVGFSQKTQTYLTYELELESKAAPFQNESKECDAAEVARTLSNLHSVSDDQAVQWIREGSIRTLEVDHEVVAAAHLSFHVPNAEIVRIATKAEYLRLGFAKRLLIALSDELGANGFKKMFLKVESTNEAAIACYQSFGFVVNESKTQTWLSIYF
ncbi:MAG: GNAT family N-acetyltransferase, partial [Proteobacteria bacterium]